MIKEKEALQHDCELCLIELEHPARVPYVEVPMMDCKYITRDMLTHPVMVKVDDNPLDFSSARVYGRRESQENCRPDPMLLAWFDRTSGRFSPDVICCDQ